MNVTTLQDALSSFSDLDEEEKALFIEITRMRMIEDRRREIRKNGDATIEAIKNNEAMIGSLDDLLADLED